MGKIRYVEDLMSNPTWIWITMVESMESAFITGLFSSKICCTLGALLAYQQGTDTHTAATVHVFAWWRHQMKETFSTLLAVCVGNSPVTGEFPAQRPVTWSFDVFFDLHLHKRLSKQFWGWWFETLSCSLWHDCNGIAWQKSWQSVQTHTLNTTPGWHQRFIANCV